MKPKGTSARTTDAAQKATTPKETALRRARFQDAPFKLPSPGAAASRRPSARLPARRAEGVGALPLRGGDRLQDLARHARRVRHHHDRQHQAGGEEADAEGRPLEEREAPQPGRSGDLEPAHDGNEDEDSPEAA